MTNIILSNPGQKSFCNSILNELKSELDKNEINNTCHDLYKEKFNPILSQKEISQRIPLDEISLNHIKDIEKTDNLVLIYPNWWGIMPAILKGWLDRILISGVAFEYLGEEFCKKEVKSLLSIKNVIVICTADEDQDTKLIKDVWTNIFNTCEIDNSFFYFLSNLRKSKYAERKEFIESVSYNTIKIICKK